jgi:DNA modification methylase
MEARILVGDVRTRLAALEDGSVRCVVTSPPYWGLRDYGRDGQIGLEQTPEEFVGKLVAVFREVRRVLADDGTLWLNLGDSYGSGKQLVGIPWRVAFALQADGWYLRQDIIWSKPNPMPESVTDRCTKAHEYVFLLTKSPRYYYDKDAVSEEYADATVKRGKSIRQVSADGTVTTRGNGEPVQGRRNRRSVWTVATKPFRGAHFAVMPETLVEPCVLAGSAEGDLVLDPFAGSGTVGVVALRHGRNFVGVELNADYAKVAQDRIYDAAPMMNTVTVIGEDDE